MVYMFVYINTYDIVYMYVHIHIYIYCSPIPLWWAPNVGHSSSHVHRHDFRSTADGPCHGDSHRHGHCGCGQGPRVNHNERLGMVCIAMYLVAVSVVLSF